MKANIQVTFSVTVSGKDKNSIEEALAELEVKSQTEAIRVLDSEVIDTKFTD